MDEEDEPSYKYISRLDKNDLGEMVKTYLSAYRGLESYADIESEESALKYLLYYFRFEEVSKYKITVDDNFSGFIFLEENNDNIEIHELAIKPDFQGYGAGYDLLDMVKNVSCFNRKYKITLWVGINNYKAKKIYNKFGFNKEMSDGKWDNLVFKNFEYKTNKGVSYGIGRENPNRFY